MSLCQPLYGLIDRLCAAKLVRIQVIVVDFFPVQLIAGANLDLFEGAQDVELGQEKCIDAADHGREAHHFGIQPAAAPDAPGGGRHFAQGLHDEFIIKISVGIGPAPTRVV